MQDNPDVQALIHAVAQFLHAEIAPTLTDSRLKFRALVAANVLTIVGRELEIGDAQVVNEQKRLEELLSDESLTPNPSPFGRGERRDSIPFPLEDGGREQANCTPLPEGEGKETVAPLSQWERSGGVRETPARTEIERLTRALAQMIRAGQADDGPFHDAVFAHVEQTVIEKLQIANPKYLERVRQETR